MSNPEDNPNQGMKVQNPDEHPENVAPHPDLIPTYSMQGYPMLPTVDYDGDLRKQAVFYNELGREAEDRLQKEIVEGCQLLAEIGMSEEEYRTQYGEEFQYYQFATTEYECIVPGTQMTALYIEFIRMFIALLMKESKRREDRETRAAARSIPGDTESKDSQGLVITNPGALTDLESPNFSASVSNSASGPAGNVPIHRDPEIRKVSISSSFDTYNGEIILRRLKHFFDKLTILDPVTTDFLLRLQTLLTRLNSQYSTAEESLENTSADASDLTEDSSVYGAIGGVKAVLASVESHSNDSSLVQSEESSLVQSEESLHVQSEESMHDIANLPEDEKSENVEEEETGL